MIHAFGCSYTYGTSCINPETDSWPAKLATLLSNDYKNYGVEGASNDYIFKTLAQNLKFIKEDDTIIIMMTKATRRYFKNIHITPYSTHNIAEVFYKYINILKFQQISSLNFVGIMLLPMNAVLVFQLNFDASAVLLSGIILLTVIGFGMIKTIQSNLKLVLSNFFYFILYICTLEFGPWILTYGLLGSNNSL